MTDRDADYRYQQTIKLFGVRPEPAFESEEEQAAVWGRRWGCDNDVGQLRVVLMHRPGPEMNVVDLDKRIESIGTFGDLEAGWYWQSDRVPPLADMQAQHDGLVKALRDEDVEVVFLYPWATKFLQLELFALIEMAVFVGILVVGQAYAWRKNDLE